MIGATAGEEFDLRELGETAFRDALLEGFEPLEAIFGQLGDALRG